MQDPMQLPGWQIPGQKNRRFFGVQRSSVGLTGQQMFDSGQSSPVSKLQARTVGNTQALRFQLFSSAKARIRFSASWQALDACVASQVPATAALLLAGHALSNI